MRDGKYVILAIDDDADILEALRLVLEANGYVMVDAATAEDGLKVYQEHNPDLVIVDMMMEEVDAGSGFVKKLKLLGSKVPAYLLTSVGDKLVGYADYSQMGFDGVFQKPVNNDALLKILKQKLG